jgi:tetratricopeptide (TPR) repeat protein
VLERALELIQKALALDDTLPWAYAMLSLTYLDKQQPEQALAAAEQAIALAPSNADSYVIQSGILRAVGRPEEALRSVEKAMRLNPRPPGWYLLTLAQVYNLTGRYAEAIAVLKP